MGGTSWSDDAYDARVNLRASTGTKTFAYHSAVSSGSVAAKTHDSLDPSKMKAGVRECRDSEAHPNSTPVYLGLDVTGSMSDRPKIFQDKLKTLMALLLKKGYVDDPAICVSAIGDAEAGDKAPFQLGQFESGIEVENDLTNIYMEGGGGGNNYESYDLALYFLARCVKTDAWEKRQKKGYAFIIADESLPRVCKSSTLKKVFNIDSEDIPTAVLMQEVLERWELFLIVPEGTSHYKSSLQNSWRDHLGQRVLYLDDPQGVVEMIAATIGLSEEAADLDSVVNDIASTGASKSTVSAVSRALAKVEVGMSKFEGTGLSKL